MSERGSQVRPIWMWLARQRTLVQAVSTLALNSYVTQALTRGLPCPALNCHACPAAAFACPIGVIQHFVARRKVPLYVVGTVALVGVLVGRASCGWFCPFGWLQELIHKLPVPKLRLPNRLNWTRYVVLAVLVIALPYATQELWFCKLCPQGTLEAAIPVALLNLEVRALVGAFYWAKLALLALFMGWMATTRRPFCRWVCPLGALWSPFNPLSAFRLRVDTARCTRCGRCQAVCPTDVRVHEDPASGACIRCLQCVRECPTGCISVVGLGRWSLEQDREPPATDAL